MQKLDVFVRMKLGHFALRSRLGALLVSTAVLPLRPCFSYSCSYARKIVEGVRTNISIFLYSP